MKTINDDKLKLYTLTVNYMVLFNKNDGYGKSRKNQIQIYKNYGAEGNATSYKCRLTMARFTQTFRTSRFLVVDPSKQSGGSPVLGLELRCAALNAIFLDIW